MATSKSRYDKATQRRWIGMVVIAALVFAGAYALQEDSAPSAEECEAIARILTGKGTESEAGAGEPDPSANETFYPAYMFDIAVSNCQELPFDREVADCAVDPSTTQAQWTECYAAFEKRRAERPKRRRY